MQQQQQQTTKPRAPQSSGVTEAELLEVAKRMGIKGRHTMKKNELMAAIREGRKEEEEQADQKGCSSSSSGAGPTPCEGEDHNPTSLPAARPEYCKGKQEVADNIAKTIEARYAAMGLRGTKVDCDLRQQQARSSSSGDQPKFHVQVDVVSVVGVPVAGTSIMVGATIPHTEWPAHLKPALNHKSYEVERVVMVYLGPDAGKSCDAGTDRLALNAQPRRLGVHEGVGDQAGQEGLPLHCGRGRPVGQHDLLRRVARNRHQVARAAYGNGHQHRAGPLPCSQSGSKHAERHAERQMVQGAGDQCG